MSHELCDRCFPGTLQRDIGTCNIWQTKKSGSHEGTNCTAGINLLYIIFKWILTTPKCSCIFFIASVHRLYGTWAFMFIFQILPHTISNQPTHLLLRQLGSMILRWRRIYGRCQLAVLNCRNPTSSPVKRLFSPHANKWLGLSIWWIWRVWVLPNVQLLHYNVSLKYNRLIAN